MGRSHDVPERESCASGEAGNVLVDILVVMGVLGLLIVCVVIATG